MISNKISDQPNPNTTGKLMDQYLSGDRPQVILSRVLGTPLMYEAKQWALGEHCWICEKWEFYPLNLQKSSLQSLGALKNCSAFSIKASFNDWRDIHFPDNDDHLEGLLLLPPGEHRLWIAGGNEIHISKSLNSLKWDGIPVNYLQVAPRSGRLSLNWETAQQEIRKFVK